MGFGQVAAVVAVALPAALLAPSPRGQGIVLGLGIAYVLSATVAVAWAERRATRASMSAVLGGQVVLGALLMSASDGVAMIAVMPTVAMAVVYRSLRAGVASIGLFCAWILFIGWTLDVGARAILQGIAGFVAAGIFVIVFSRIALAERLARVKVELLAGELERANGRLHDYAAQVEELATAKERNRIAREIHDSLGHYLTAANVQLEAARTVLAADDPPRALECIDRAQAATREGLADVRRSVTVLRAPLRDAVQALVDECRASGLEAALTVDGTARPLAPRVEFALYRAVQEALTNVRRHAQAARVEVGLKIGTNDVALVVEDDGVGANGTPNGAGFGLLGLRERVELVGGRVTIRTAPRAGFAIRIQVPG
jgi:signal transduction histidine kinase